MTRKTDENNKRFGDDIFATSLEENLLDITEVRIEDLILLQ